MVKKTTYKTKEKLIEENWALRQLVWELYEKKIKGMYVLTNGNLPEKFNPKIEEAFSEWLISKGI